MKPLAGLSPPDAAMACWLACLLASLLAGCERNRQDMYDQPKYKPMAASALFADGASARSVPAGAAAQARGNFAGSSSGRLGEQLVQAERAAATAQAMPYPMTLALLTQGQQRYDIYCLPCHGAVGAGDGRVVRRGFPRPLPFDSARVRKSPDRHLYEVISDGYGLMFPFADKLDPSERWAVVAYLRALQLSQHADAAQLPPQWRLRLPPPPSARPSPSPPDQLPPSSFDSPPSPASPPSPSSDRPLSPRLPPPGVPP